MVWCLPIDLVVSSSNTPSAKLSLRVRKFSICNSRGMNYEVCSPRDKIPGQSSISRKLFSVRMSAFEIYLESYEKMRCEIFRRLCI